VLTEPDNQPGTTRYWAFISYSHADRAWADWLHKALERYRIPRRLIGLPTATGPIPARIAPVFLDRAELAASGDLDASIRNALCASRSMIVICSPAATTSSRVTQEIELFRDLKSSHILPLIVAGRPNAEQRGGSAMEECFPLPLRNRVILETGGSTAPFAADLRPGKGGRQEALLKVVAGILDLNLNQLRQRDTQRRRLRWVTATILCLAGMLGASGLAAYAWTQRNAALKAQVRLLTEVATQRLNAFDVAGARGIILEVLTNPEYAPGRTSAEINVFQEVRAADAQLAVLSGHTDFLRSASYSPDGKRIVTASLDKTARIWDARTGVQLAVLSGHGDRVNSAVFSPDGMRIVTASSDKTARIWDAGTGAQLAELSGHDDRLISAEYSPDGTRIVTASYGESPIIWDVRTGVKLTTLAGHSATVTHAAYSPDGARIVTASFDQTARIWDARTGASLAVLSGHAATVESAAYSPDGAQIVTASADKTARIWDSRTGASLAVLSGHAATVESAAYSPNGAQIVTASDDKTARVWNAHTGALLAVLSGHGDRVASAAYSPDGSQIVTASVDQTARIWDAHAAQAMVFEGHHDLVRSAAYSPDGTRVVTASFDQTARIWDARTGAQLAVLSGHRDRVISAVYSHDGMHILTASDDQTARVWDARTGAQLAILTGHRATVESAAFSPDDTRIVTASFDQTARIWDARRGVQLTVLSGHGATIETAAYSPDGTHIVTASDDQTARVWDARTGAQLAVLYGHGAAVESAAYSPDGMQIITASDDKTVRIWNSRTAAQVAVLFGHSERVISAAYSPDGTRVVSASSDKTARIWDARTGVQLTVLAGHGDRVSSAEYSPDGAHVVTASSDKTARIWDARVPSNIETQIIWYRSAQSDPLSEVDRADLALPSDSRAGFGSKQGSPCDRSAAAFYDPNRLAQGVSRTRLNGEIASTDCALAIASPNHTPRADYQMGRALMAKRDMNGARRQLELAVSKGYPAARVDLGNLLLDQTAAAPDPVRAASLYERAWKEGISIAAYQLGHLYEYGAKGIEGASPDVIAPDQERAWFWYQKGVEVGEPNALARFAERDENDAQLESDPSRSNLLLLKAFGRYAGATERGMREDWPDDARRHWRYRRSTLARLLAREGLMSLVADTYLHVHEIDGK
jgi:WD40 repeat protein